MDDDLDGRALLNTFHQIPTTLTTSTSSASSTSTSTSTSSTSVTSTISSDTSSFVPPTTAPATSTIQTTQATSSPSTSTDLSTALLPSPSTNANPVVPTQTTTATNPELDSTKAASSNGLPTSMLAIAIAAPVAVVLLLAACLLLCRRRRRRRATGFNPAMQQRPRENSFVPAMLTGANTTYYTGLDTDSRHEPSSEDYAAALSATSSSSSDLLPPPPYAAKTQASRSAGLSGQSIEMSNTRATSGTPQHSPTPHSWVTAPTAAASTESMSVLQPSMTQASAASFNSDLYSDTASIRSAHPARVSVNCPAAAATVLSQLDPVQPGDHDPFADPASPISSVGGEESGTVTSPSRCVSPISG